MTSLLRGRFLPTALMVVALGNVPVTAQEVQWRSDYNGAVRESTEKGKTLFLDVGKDNCLHCVKLDLSTFRDPALVRLLNESFVPVRVDGERNSVQVQGQVIQSFPTLVFISSDNRVLLQHEGYLDAATLLPQLQRMVALKAARTPAPAAQTAAAPPQAPARPAVPQQQQQPPQPQAPVAKAPTTSEPPAAAAPQQLGVSGNAPSPSAQAKKGSTTPFQADTKIGPTEQRRQVWPAPHDTVRPSSPNYPVAEERGMRAKQLLTLAQEDYQRQQWLACLEHCKTLMLLYPDMQESLDARQLALRIKSNPELLERLGRDLTEHLAEVYWELAQTKLRQNQATAAVPYLEKIVQTCPGTRFVPAAQDYLSRLSRPTRIGVKTF